MSNEGSGIASRAYGTGAALVETLGRVDGSMTLRTHEATGVKALALEWCVVAGDDLRAIRTT